MITRGVSIAIALIANLVLLPHAFAQTDFDDMTPAEKLAARNEAAKLHVETLKVCADGGNLPFSNLKSEGFENKIARDHRRFDWRAAHLLLASVARTRHDARGLRH